MLNERDYQFLCKLEDGTVLESREEVVEAHKWASIGYCTTGFTTSKEDPDRYDYLLDIMADKDGIVYRIREIDPKKGMRVTYWNSRTFKEHLGATFADSLPDRLERIALKQLGEEELQKLREVNNNPNIGKPLTYRVVNRISHLLGVS